MLELSLKESATGFDAAELLEAALEDDNNRRAAFDFLRKNYDAIAAKLPQNALASPIVWLMEPLGDLCTREERTLFVDFFKDRAPALFGAPRAYQEALERIDICVAAHANP
jgi:alanyl aminopeptidase